MAGSTTRSSRWYDDFAAKPIRVDGGIKARSARGEIGESWWSKRFLAVLESLAIGGRLNRGRNYARAGQVLSLAVSPGRVTAVVQGSRPQPYDVRIGLARYPDAVWRTVEAALAAQALFSARLLAGEMPGEIEAVFAAAGSPLFPTSARDLDMSCSCPDWQVPCKHLAATFYLLAEAFDADPFQILLWRGRARDELLDRLRELRSGGTTPAGRKRPTTRSRATGSRASGSRASVGPPQPAVGAARALADLADARHTDDPHRYFLPPVPLPPRPPVLASEPDLLLRQLPTPGPAIGGAELVEQLRPLYRRFSTPPSDSP